MKKLILIKILCWLGLHQWEHIECNYMCEHSCASLSHPNKICKNCGLKEYDYDFNKVDKLPKWKK